MQLHNLSLRLKLMNHFFFFKTIFYLYGAFLFSPVRAAKVKIYFMLFDLQVEMVRIFLMP